jgi:hypothetical protein
MTANRIGDNNTRGLRGICPNCGAPNLFGSLECGHCGTGFLPVAAGREQAMTPPPITPAAAPQNVAARGPAANNGGQLTASDKASIVLGAILIIPLFYGMGALIYSAGDHRTNKEYTFNNKIDGENVEFSESVNGKTNYLGITKEDGTFILFTDKKDDLKIDEMSIRTCYVTREETAEIAGLTECNETAYSLDSRNPVAQQIVKDNQAVFDSYLEKILDASMAPLNGAN